MQYQNVSLICLIFFFFQIKNNMYETTQMKTEMQTEVFTLVVSDSWTLRRT